MLVVIQRVKKAKVIASEKREVLGEIEKGLFILIGIKKGDTEKEADYLATKISKLRVMADKEKKMNLAVNDVNGQVLVVSQFTLYGDTKGQNRPSFIKAAGEKEAKRLYEYFVEKLRKLNLKVEIGSFGDYMEIETLLDGPVTITIDSNFK